MGCASRCSSAWWRPVPCRWAPSWAVGYRSPSGCLPPCSRSRPGPSFTALAFELFEDSYEKGGLWRSVLGLLAGAMVFTVISQRLDRLAEGHRPDDGSEKPNTDAPASDAAPSSASVTGSAGLALLAAVTLDGVPENLALGVSLGEGSGGIALLAASLCRTSPRRWSAALRCALRAAATPS